MSSDQVFEKFPPHNDDFGETLYAESHAEIVTEIEPFFDTTPQKLTQTAKIWGNFEYKYFHTPFDKIDETLLF